MNSTILVNRTVTIMRSDLSINVDAFPKLKYQIGHGKRRK